MNSAYSLSVVQQTALVLWCPSYPALLRDRHDDGLGLRPSAAPGWCACGSAAMLCWRSSWRCCVGGRAQTDLYSAVALERRALVLRAAGPSAPGAILLGLAHDQPDDDRAAEFFGVAPDDQRRRDARRRGQRAGLPVRRARAGEHPDLPAPLPLAANATTQEAATKYFFLSIFSSGLLLFGLAFLYGMTGVSNLKALAYLVEHAAERAAARSSALIAVVFVMAGLGFRVAAVPFHFYAPDVYQGSPTVIAAVLAWIPKAVGFLAIIRTLTAVFSVRAANDPLVRQGGDALVDHRGGDDDLGQLPSRSCRRTSSGCWPIRRSPTPAT